MSECVGDCEYVWVGDCGDVMCLLFGTGDCLSERFHGTAVHAQSTRELSCSRAHPTHMQRKKINLLRCYYYPFSAWPPQLSPIPTLSPDSLHMLAASGRCNALSHPHSGSRQGHARCVLVNYKEQGRFESLLSSNIRLSSVPVIDAAEFMHQVTGMAGSIVAATRGCISSLPGTGRLSQALEECYLVE